VQRARCVQNLDAADPREIELAPRHQWVVAPFRADREAPLDGRRHWFVIDAHRNHCGPYTAAGGLIRQLAKLASIGRPGLLQAHQLTLLFVSPDIRNHVATSDETNKWLAVSHEGDRRSWTHGLAHGIIDFLLDYVAQMPKPSLAVSFENADMAEPLDQEFIAVLLRRAAPERLLVRVSSSRESLDGQLLSALKSHASLTRQEPTTPASANGFPNAWRSWLRQGSAGWRGEWAALADLSRYLDFSANAPPTCGLNELLATTLSRVSLIERRKLARHYVESNCTSDRLVAKQAYISLPDEERKILHLARAKELDELNHECLRLGAIPFHYEQAGVNAASMLAASNRCMRLASYDVALDWALRGRRMNGNGHIDYSAFTRNILFSLLLLGRFEEVESVCSENLGTSTDPRLLARIAYAKAILNARYYNPQRRDYDAARAWIEKGLAYMAMLPFSQDVAGDIALLRNALALVEFRTGRIAVAHQLLSNALDYLAKEAPDSQDSERTILLENRARLHVAMKMSDQAINDLRTLLEIQPGDSAAYFNCALIYQRLGKHEKALCDYNAAIQWSPPYPESYFNRALSLAALGRIAEALADYARVLTLDPNHIGAMTNRARLLYDQGNFVAARRNVEAGLSVSPADARLLCLLGLLQIKDGHLDRAQESLTNAIQADASLADAWANRAAVLFKQGDLAGAQADSTQALTLHEDANILYNRGRIFEAQSKWTEAIQDYSRALGLAGEGVQHIVVHRDLCRIKLEKEQEEPGGYRISVETDDSAASAFAEP
jgi:tetratricopeptide (TPR) repeat protein